MRKKVLALVVTVVMMLGASTFTVNAQTVLPEPSFNIVVDVLEWGSPSTAVVIDLGQAIKSLVLDNGA